MSPDSARLERAATLVLVSAVASRAVAIDVLRRLGGAAGAAKMPSGRFAVALEALRGLVDTGSALRVDTWADAIQARGGDWNDAERLDAHGFALSDPSGEIAVLLDAWRWREIRAIGQRVQALAADEALRADAGLETPEAVAAAVLEDLRAVTSDSPGEDRPVTAPEMRARADVYRAVVSGESSPGWNLGTGGDLDRVLVLRPGGLYVIGGLNKSGKSKLQVWLGHRLASRSIPVLDCSLEMGRDLRWDWYVSQHLGIDSSTIGTPEMPRHHVDALLAASHPVYALSLTIDDRPSRTVRDLELTVQEWRAGLGGAQGLVLVDYVQLLNTERERGENEAVALSRLAKGLAALAKRQKTCVVATAQLNRVGESEEPGPQHLEGSGGFAQASMGMLFLDNLVRRGRVNSYDPTRTAFSWRVVQRAGRSGRGSLVVDLTTGGFEAAGPEDEELFRPRGRNNGWEAPGGF